MTKASQDGVAAISQTVNPSPQVGAGRVAHHNYLISLPPNTKDKRVKGRIMDPIHIFTVFAIVLAVGIIAQMVGRLTRMPSIVFLLAAGILLGPECAGLIDPWIYGDGLNLIITFAVVIIVFDGGINVDLRHLRRVSGSVLALISIGVLITMIGGAVAAHELTGLDWHFALLFGALAAATGPTVIVPLMKAIRVNNRVRSILEVEGIFNDAVSIILAALIFEWIVTPYLHPGYGIAMFLMRIATGGAVGLAGGLLCVFALPRIHAITNELLNITTVSFVLITYTVAELILSETGIFAVAVAAICVGASDIPHKKEIQEFKNDLSIILLSIIFVLLAAMLNFDSIRSIGINGVFVAAALIFIVRPVVVFASTLHSKLRWKERLFISAIGPRGVVPAAMATYFAIELADAEAGSTIMGLVFICIIITVTLTGVSARPVARALGVIPMEILIVGGGGVGCTLAHRLIQRGENVVVVDIDPENCRRVEELGVPAVEGDAGDVAVLTKAGIKNARYLVATTDQDGVNLLVCQIAKNKFGVGDDKLVARVNDPKNLSTFRDLGIRSMSPITSAASILDNLITHPSLFSMYELGERGDIIEIPVANQEMIGMPVRDLQLPTDVLIVLVRRGDATLIPHGDLVIESGDRVTFMGARDAVRKAVDMFW
uniref:K(+)/H(+) antiporter NhaP2 n=1 Tax=Candidatus Methanogaster sp. ANME-2c ERB4 TaxID=2759911 RepID=A0A7G9YBU1_9EURY|nr:K(+)/H(+) antiporter NhaP2 [Methanosarcinales archaeon ANME-2c ERB4]QNO46871.1 K(+)/H(+) antiporter NhaP2 [Methanosarcinales archaeon ANME-2c ERB4]